MPVIDAVELNQKASPLILQPHETDTREAESLPYVNEPWDIQRYAEPHIPIILGHLRNMSSILRVIDLLVKIPQSDEIVLPKELTMTHDFIQQIINYVKSKYPDRYANSYAYLTTDSGMIPPSSYQRNSGLHVDGFEGSRIKEPLLTDFSFIAHNNDEAATIFYLDPFPCAHLDRSADNFSAYWTQYARKHNYQRIYARAHTIYGMNAYTIHESGQNLTDEPIQRSFFRLSFSVREFDRLGNTQNPFLDLNWKYYPRDIQDSLNTHFPELDEE